MKKKVLIFFFGILTSISSFAEGGHEIGNGGGAGVGCGLKRDLIWATPVAFLGG